MTTVFEKPENGEAKIWRYMDFTKYVSLLDTACLYFFRGDLLDDLFEGSLLPSKLLKNVSKTDAMAFAEKMRWFRETITVNCWHMSEHESAAMWKLYLTNSQGIAVQSTYKDLVEAFAQCSAEVHIGQIRYIDYEEDVFEGGDGLDVFTPFMYKRKSFQHEQELRAVIWDIEDTGCDGDGGGLWVPVDLDKLLNGVYVCPESPGWVEQLVRSISEKYGVTAPIVRSSLSEGPLY